MSRKAKRKVRGTWGLYAKNFPRGLRGYVDQDYLDKLSPEERLWLARFNDHFYGADFRTDYEEEWPKEERRKRYVAKNVSNCDVYGAAQAAELLEPIEARGDMEAPETDWSQVPDYLNSPRYKAALDEFRSHLKPGRKPSMPEDTPALNAARYRLERAKYEPPEEDDEGPGDSGD